MRTKATKNIGLNQALIEELFRVGFTDDELVEVFNFGKDDVSAVVDEIEEGD